MMNSSCDKDSILGFMDTLISDKPNYCTTNFKQLIDKSQSKFKTVPRSKLVDIATNAYFNLSISNNVYSYTINTNNNNINTNVNININNNEKYNTSDSLLNIILMVYILLIFVIQALILYAMFKESSETVSQEIVMQTNTKNLTIINDTAEYYSNVIYEYVYHVMSL